MKKKSIILFSALALALSFTLGVGAAPVLERITANLNWSIEFQVDGEPWAPTDQNGNSIAPISYNNTTYLPVRAVSEALGTAVDWDQATQTITLGEKSDTTAITSEKVDTAHSSNITSDKQYTVQAGTDYQTGVIIESVNSAAKAITIHPAGKYQTLDLSVFAINSSDDITVTISNGDVVVRELTLTSSNSSSEVTLDIGGIQELKIAAQSRPGADEKVFVTGSYR
ncbi:stalk domain-containing protein [Bacillus horti]|uniref:Copper amine oxidase-like N-terminal domain-containing protein n=1 Tax=Caldalkalibacillus horti TaxID=77523 RepID=A0ABT9VUS8_9BACI|nr:stalk domain-containing protein [Bacillus horti]MDQ0164740.1 hypothetical protein [Bacillus horti]